MTHARRWPRRATAVLAVAVLAACSSDDSPAATSPPASAATSTSTTSAADGWTVDTEECVDPAAARAPITGTVHIGSVMPLSGGPAASFAPVADGFRTYVEYANEQRLLGDVRVELTIGDDQYTKDLTPGVVTELVGEGVHLFSGVLGTPNNAAVRDTLNDECIPQLNALTGSPMWGDVGGHPWTTGLLVPFDVEAKVYAAQLAELFPEGATVAIFSVDNEYGQTYVEAFKQLTEQYGLEIVSEQTVDPADAAPPTSAITQIAEARPDAILSVPLGAGCGTFLTELGAAKAQRSGWSPATLLTSNCASQQILGAAGEAADGLYTSNSFVDVNDPASRAQPGVATYLAELDARGLTDSASLGEVGWTAAEVTVAVLAQAQASPAGLTRASIIEAARDFTFTASLTRPGIVYRLDGERDPFLSQSLQVLQYAAGSQTFTPVGPVITAFET